MSNPISLSNNIIEGIEGIISQAKDLSRPVQHEYFQQELYNYFRKAGFEAFFEYEVEFYHIYRSTKIAGQIRLIKNGRLDFYAKKDDIKIAVEIDSGATLKWKSIEKLLHSDAQYCFGIVSGSKNDDKVKLDMYNEKNLWKCQVTLEDQISLCDKNREFEKLINLLNKNFWIGNIKTNELKLIDLKEVLVSSISLCNLKKNSQRNSINNKISTLTTEKIYITEHREIEDNFIVIIKLQNDKWYVGKTENVESFIDEIKNGNGPRWTQFHKFVSLYNVIQNGDLKTITLDYMKEFGWQNVRGYAWSQINMKRPPKALRVGKLQNAVSKEKFDETVYILKLEDNKWFLGKCLNEYISRRINKQKNGLGNEWTKTYKVLEVHKLVENGDLKELTLNYMKKYGWENVRGYSWIQKNMKKPPKLLYKN